MKSIMLIIMENIPKSEIKTLPVPPYQPFIQQATIAWLTWLDGSIHVSPYIYLGPPNQEIINGFSNAALFKYGKRVKIIVVV